MPIDMTERYKLIFKEHQFASDFRMRILQLWGLVYAALATAFGWVNSMAPALNWIVPAIAVLSTLLVWIGDVRNRDGIRGSKAVGAAIENDPNSGIPESQRYFTRLAVPGSFLTSPISVSHSFAINAFAIVMCVLLIWATVYLFLNKGVLPR